MREFVVEFYQQAHNMDHGCIHVHHEENSQDFPESKIWREVWDPYHFWLPMFDYCLKIALEYDQLHACQRLLAHYAANLFAALISRRLCAYKFAQGTEKAATDGEQSDGATSEDDTSRTETAATSASETAATSESVAESQKKTLIADLLEELLQRRGTSPTADENATPSTRPSAGASGPSEVMIAGFKEQIAGFKEEIDELKASLSPERLNTLEKKKPESPQGTRKRTMPGPSNKLFAT
jgi:hypothetical protein